MHPGVWQPIVVLLNLGNGAGRRLIPARRTEIMQRCIMLACIIMLFLGVPCGIS
jgi:hypothetical protein